MADPRSPDPGELRFFNPWADLQQTKNRLPHWQQPGATYFLTFRLADAVPRAQLDRLANERDTWLIAHPRPHDAKQIAEFNRRFSIELERLVDQGYGRCQLREPAARDALANILMKYDRSRYWQHSWIIMPNHVHVLVTLAPNTDLGALMKAWKGASAHLLRAQDGSGRGLWQKDYFDRVVRNGTHFWSCARYIRRNPLKACLRRGEATLFENAAISETLESAEAELNSFRRLAL